MCLFSVFCVVRINIGVWLFCVCMLVNMVKLFLCGRCRFSIIVLNFFELRNVFVMMLFVVCLIMKLFCVSVCVSYVVNFFLFFISKICIGCFLILFWLFFYDNVWCFDFGYIVDYIVYLMCSIVVF